MFFAIRNKMNVPFSSLLFFAFLRDQHRPTGERSSTDGPNVPQRGKKPMTGKPHPGGCSTGTLLIPVGVVGLFLVGTWALGSCFFDFLDNLFNFGPDLHQARQDAVAQRAPAAFPLLVVQLIFLPVLFAVGIVLSARLGLGAPWKRGTRWSLTVVTLAGLAAGAIGLGHMLIIEAPAVAEWQKGYADGPLAVFSLGGDRLETREERQATARKAAWGAFRHVLPVPIFLTGYAALLLTCLLRCRSPVVASPAHG
jgi:hypothetical protein